MGKLLIDGGRRLYGSAKIQGAKNAALPILAAALMSEETITIHNTPRLNDIDNMSKLLGGLGLSVRRENNSVSIDSTGLCGGNIVNPISKELRSSIFLLGPVLGKLRHAMISFPGGCDIGLRPIDIHLKALREMNVTIDENSGYLLCDAGDMRAADIVLDYPSVGATENVMMAATLTDGVTTLTNAAREPEIVDLQEFINSMGGKVRGAGTSYIEITGVRKLHGTEYNVMADRIVAGTVAIGVAMAGGEVNIVGCKWDTIGALLAKLSKTSCNVNQKGDIIEITSRGRRDCVENIETQPYPGFPTDLQAPMTALQSVSNGVSVVTENIFENRFRYTQELRKMGAKIKIQGRSAIVRGVRRLRGAEVAAHDLRGGAALVLAGLNAEGTTTVDDIYHIDRGYERIEDLFSALGANIRRL